MNDVRQNLIVNCNSLSETNALAGCFAYYLSAGLVVGLTGPLGAGKSAFARCLIQRACGADTDVPSPTFTLVQSYETADGLPIMHMDLYRLEAPEDVFALGIEDSFYEAANLVEWPSKMGAYWPAHAVMIAIDFAQGEGRRFGVSAPSEMLESLCQKALAAGLSAALSQADAAAR